MMSCRIPVESATVGLPAGCERGLFELVHGRRHGEPDEQHERPEHDDEEAEDGQP